MERQNLWAPWRIKYIQGLTNDSKCFLCDALADPQKDRDKLVLWRTQHAFVIFNKYPYNNGHLLVAPVQHIPDFNQCSDEQMLAILKLVRDCQRVLDLAVKPHGYNIGMNFGRCAGAGLPDHMHVHVVPRWNGDTNYMHVCGNTDVISQGLHELFDLLVNISQREHLPAISQ